MNTIIPVIVLLVVFILIAVRRIGRYRLQIWQIMLLGALAVLVSGQIPPIEALRAINPDVMLFLFGVFVIGQALEESGYLSHLSYRFFVKAGSLERLVLFVLLGAGGMSAFLMNDTLAVIGTPVMLHIARKNTTCVRSPKVLLLALAFAVTIGSVASPIGNPQNLLIAINGGIANPFVTFFRFLLLPTIVNLFLAYLLLRLFFRKHFDGHPLHYSPEPMNDNRLARLSKVSLSVLVVLIAVKIALVFLGSGIDFKLTYIALAAAAPILLVSSKRFGIARRIDWSTLLFFAAMFVLMESVWESGFFQSVLNGTAVDLSSTGAILGVSIVLSQFISNVPLVALYLPMLAHAGAGIKGMMALAAGSTIAGNLTILGAASNVIIIQNAEKKGGETLSFWDFVRIGIPLTLVNAGVYWVFSLL
ncbi:MAG: anion transporter [Chloroflexi bacterium RBG_16_57_8]|nr:MAG: anion transporter [Chloroflexi bacterium RBG_16_57_8]